MKKAKVFVLIILLVVLVVTLAKVVQQNLLGYDWEHTYRPAALVLARGDSPYSIEIFFAAPWSLIPLIPFALLPEKAGVVGVFFLGLFAFAYTAHKLSATTASMVIFLLSAPVVGCLMWGNIEWMPLMGLVLPAPIGLILAIIKPQVGIGIVVFWFIQSLRSKDWAWEITKAFAPVTILTLLSFWMYGFWPLRFQQTLNLSQSSSAQYNSSLWPYGIFIGIWLLYKSIQKNQAKTAMAASPFLSPYTLQYTWVAILTGLIHAPLELLLVSIGLWIPVALRVISQ